MKKILAFLVSSVIWNVAAAQAQAPIPQPPAIDAKSYVLMDFVSGEVLAGLNEDARVEPASITKVMTTYIAFDEIRKGRLRYEDTALISEKAWRQGKDSTESRMFLEVGSRVKIIDLMRGIIIASGNDASIALAEHIAGSESAFAELMNQYAQSLGLKNTHFADASGLPAPDHYSTARDLALLGRALIRDFPEGYKIYSEQEFKYGPVAPQPNRNYLLKKDPSVDGIKTGHTRAAGYCLLASAERNGRRLVSAVMGANTWAYREQASLELLNYGFRFFEAVPLFGTANPVANLRVWKGAEEQVPVGVAQTVNLSVPRGGKDRLQIVPQVSQQVVAPVTNGQVLGTISVSLDGKLLYQQPLVALKDVPEGSLWQRASDSVRMWIGE